MKKKNKTPKNPKTNSNAQTSNSVKSKIKDYIVVHYLALIPIILALVGIFASLYIAYSEPDIRGIAGEGIVTLSSPPIKTDDGKCVYFMAVKHPFKNMSFKSGYISNVNFVPMTLDMITEFTLVDVDRSKISWREQKDIEVKYTLALPPTSCQKLKDNPKPLTLGLNFYDSSGKLINQDVDGQPFIYEGSIPFGK